MVGDDKMPLEDLCLLKQNAVLLGKQLLESEATICSKIIRNYLMTEIASHIGRNVSLTAPISESAILKCHLFRGCAKMTNIYIETVITILDTSLSLHYHTHYRSDVTEGYIVYSVCQSNTVTWGKNTKSCKYVTYSACKFKKYSSSSSSSSNNNNNNNNNNNVEDNDGTIDNDSKRDGRGFEWWYSIPTWDFGAYQASCQMLAHGDLDDYVK
jgi:hypothetical protein